MCDTDISQRLSHGVDHTIVEIAISTIPLRTPPPFLLSIPLLSTNSLAMIVLRPGNLTHG